MTSTINYKELYMDTLYHYLAEIYVISEKDTTNKEDKIKNYMDKIKKHYDIDKINEINDLIINIEEANDIKKFNNELKTIISK
jgi:hypothetical protein